MFPESGHEMTSFNFAWVAGKRTPDTVILPDGTVKTVAYMRDGLILFTDNTSASYERMGDYEATMTLNETFEQTLDTLANYLENNRPSAS